MESQLPDFTYWGWMIAGLVFAVLEMALPVMFFLWIGIAALLTGVLKLLMPGVSPEIQLMMFAVIALLSLAGSRWYLRSRPIQSDSPNLNRKGRQYIGRQFVLEQAIVNGVGRIKVDDSFWKVRGVDAPLGSKVKVVDVDGLYLLVEVCD